MFACVRGGGRGVAMTGGQSNNTFTVRPLETSVQTQREKSGRGREVV